MPEVAPVGGVASGRHPAAVLRRLHSRPRRRLSQSFLARGSIADAMVRAASLEPTDTVLEIGPGLGMLTARLVRACSRVVAVELDAELARQLPALIGTPSNLRVVVGDARTVELAALVMSPYCVVASLPYHVATPILFRLLFEAPRPARLVVMVQDEVAQRLTAGAGARTYLSTAIELVASARLVRRVPPTAFFPTPKVWSAIVRLDVRPAPLVPFDDLEAFRAFLLAGFAQPRKQLPNSLAHGLGVPPAAVRAAAHGAGIDPTRRPADLDLEEWATLRARLAPP